VKIIKSPRILNKIVQDQRRKGKVIGFVPTMGALHQGHLALVKKALKETDFVVVSIFVNPLQFGENEDFNKYIRTFEQDKKLLSSLKVDLVFYPNASDIYSQGFSTIVSENYLSKSLCGKYRKGHFQGVTTVVAKLFNIVSPDIAYFGRKDYQQFLVIRRIVRDLNFDLKLKMVKLIRDKDGLALSSRNKYLSSKQRIGARVIYDSLVKAKELLLKGKKDVNLIKSIIRKTIKQNSNSRVNYIELVDAEDLKSISEIKKDFLIAIAVYFGDTRLIDNMLVKYKRGKFSFYL